MQSRLNLDGFLPIHARRAAPVQRAVIQAALEGLGVAIGRPTVIAPRVERRNTGPRCSTSHKLGSAAIAVWLRRLRSPGGRGATPPRHGTESLQHDVLMTPDCPLIANSVAFAV